VLKTGAAAVPLSVDLKADALREALAGVRPAALISSARLERLVREVAPGLLEKVPILISNPSLSWQPRSVTAFEDVVNGGAAADAGLQIEETGLASIVYTSGSTGRPKGVMLSHKNIVSNTLSIVQCLRLAESDIQMAVLPFSYVMGKSLLNTHVAVGGTVVINNKFAYPACVVEQMVAERVTGFSGVPSTYAYLLNRSPLLQYRHRLETLRYCSQAGGHMARPLKERLLETLPPHTLLYIMYGATEAAARLAYVEPERLRSKMESIGRPIPGVTIRVLDPQGRELPAGQPGELVADGPNIMLGYWMDPEATATVLDRNGYHTGDLGYADADGYLYVSGRKDDLLKVGGHRVNPREIEDVLMASGLLVEVAVVALDDEMHGQRLVALAVPVDGAVTQKEVLARGLARLPRSRLPGELRLVRCLPKHASGKVDRAACKELWSRPPEERDGCP
jgi:acyl-CoA synthetase (AMP-forming)/AMP-acid ligase II